MLLGRIQEDEVTVDCVVMPRGVTFDDLLQQKLSSPPIDSRPAGIHGPAGMGAAYGFFFVEGSRRTGSLMSGSRAGVLAAAAAPPQDHQPASRIDAGRSVTARSAATLSASERRAFDQL